jgi:hypothetical protein
MSIEERVDNWKTNYPNIARVLNFITRHIIWISGIGATWLYFRATDNEQRALLGTILIVYIGAAIAGTCVRLFTKIKFSESKNGDIAAAIIFFAVLVSIALLYPNLLTFMYNNVSVQPLMK